MSRDDFKPGDRVINIKTRAKGWVVPDAYACCAPDEVPVLYENESGYIGTDWRELFKLETVK